MQEVHYRSNHTKQRPKRQKAVEKRKKTKTIWSRTDTITIRIGNSLNAGGEGSRMGGENFSNPKKSKKGLQQLERGGDIRTVRGKNENLKQGEKREPDSLEMGKGKV